MSDYDEQETQQVVYQQANWRWSWWDIAATAASVTGGILGSFAQGANMLARELYAAGAWTRDRKDRDEYIAAYDEEQLKQAELLERMTGMDEGWVSDETKPEDLR